MLISCLLKILHFFDVFIFLLVHRQNTFNKTTYQTPEGLILKGKILISTNSQAILLRILRIFYIFIYFREGRLYTDENPLSESRYC